MLFTPLALALTLSTPAHAGPSIEVEGGEHLKHTLEVLEQLEELGPALERLEQLEDVGESVEALGDVVVFEPNGGLSVLGDLVVVREDGVEVAGVVSIDGDRIDIAGVVVIDGERVTVMGVTLPGA